MRSTLSLSLVVFVISLSSFSAEAAMSKRPIGSDTRVTNPSAVSLEVLGRAMLYSVNFDQAVNDDIVVGGGFGSVSTQVHNTSIDTGQTASFVPVYMNYYFMRQAGSPFVTGGATLILNYSAVKYADTSTGGLQIPSSSVMPTFGAGYENRGDNGFLFRVTGYLIAGKSLAPWVGFSFGYGF